MKKGIVTGLFSICFGLVSLFAQTDGKLVKTNQTDKSVVGKTTDKVTKEAEKKSDGKRFETKEEQRAHAEEKSKGNAFSGKGNGNDKGQGKPEKGAEKRPSKENKPSKPVAPDSRESSKGKQK